MKLHIQLAALGAVCLVSACGENEGSVPPTVSAEREADASAAAPPTDANGYPLFRAGLWLQTETREGETASYEMCRAAGPDENLRALLSGERPGCEVSRGTSGGALEVSARCRMEAGEVQTVIRMTGNEGAYNVQIDTTLTQGGEVQMSDRIVGEGRWISDCPSDMAPGDEREASS